MNPLRILTFALMLAPLAVFSQKEGNIWHFGREKALDFNSGTAVVTTPSAMWTFEGSASIADADGNLLFYTNGGGRDPLLSGQPGGKIWNRNHDVMYDMGNTEGGGFSSAQSSVIVPKPGQAGHYYLFTMEEVEFYVGGDIPSQPQGRGLSYFDIDMSLNGGLGGVASYTGMIYLPTYEGLCAIRHANGTDYWIIVHQTQQSGLAVFRVDAGGVSNPVSYDVPFGTNGIIKGAPTGNRIGVSSGNGYVVCDFDAATGVVGASTVVADDVNMAEFSPNGKRLFITSNTGQIDYFELDSPDIASSRTNIGALPPFGFINGQMQLAPDGEIYMLQTGFTNNTSYLSTIVCPNATPFFQFQKIALINAPDDLYLGLPNFDNAIFRNDNAPPLSFSLGPDRSICAGETLTLNPGISGSTYAWSNGSSAPTVDVDASGVYAVTITQGCSIGIDSVQVEVIDVNADAGPDIEICRGEQIQFNATGNGDFLWSPADQVSDPTIPNPVFTGNNSTVLNLSVTQDGCTDEDAVQIIINENPVAGAAPADTTIDAGVSINLFATGDGGLEWTPATGLSCTDCPDPVASPEQSTVYIVTLTNDAGCTDTASVRIEVTPPDCDPEIPNAFTPNGDSNNDSFRPIGTITAYDMYIYNRWGQKVFEGATAWDGRENGRESPSDVYLYRINLQICGEEKKFSGEVVLIR